MVAQPREKKSSGVGPPGRSRGSPPVIGRSLYLGHGLGWLVNLRWIACAGLFFSVWLASGPLEVLGDPAPLYSLGAILVLYNALLHIFHSRLTSLSGSRTELVLFAQIIADLAVLTLLLYYAGLSHNPFVLYYFFHIIIAGILLPVRYAYIAAVLASAMAGSAMFLQHAGLIEAHPLAFASVAEESTVLVAGKVIALSSTLLLSAYFTHSMLEQVRAAEHEIRQQDKLLSLGRLVSGIIHQVRNPLDGLKNCLHFIGEDRHTGAECGKYARLMSGELERIERLTERLQDYARPRPVELEEVDVNRQVEQALGLLEMKRSDSIGIETDLAARTPARADPFALQEIVLNLCRNAVDAMPAGGRLTVRTREERTGAGPGVMVAVEDTGHGIERRDLDNIFEAFYTTKSTREGSGLGLWICRTLAVQMGARLRVESSPGRGSMFSIHLPAANSRPPERSDE